MAIGTISVGVAQALANYAGAAPDGMRLTKAQAMGLQRAALALVSEHRQRLSVPVGAIRNARGRVQVVERSRPGEYPRRDTGALVNGIAIENKSLQEIMRTGTLRVGLRKAVFYGAYLEVVYHRLGLRRTMRSMISRLMALANVPMRYQFINVRPGDGEVIR